MLPVLHETLFRNMPDDVVGIRGEPNNDPPFVPPPGRSECDEFLPGCIRIQRYDNKYNRVLPHLTATAALLWSLIWSLVLPLR